MGGTSTGHESSCDQQMHAAANVPNNFLSCKSMLQNVIEYAASLREFCHEKKKNWLNTLKTQLNFMLA